MAAAEFRAMGSGWRVTADADVAAAVARVEELEARWSRFRPDSEVSRLASGRPVRVGADTRDVVRRAVAAWRATGGRFDPTVRVAALGYDRSWERGTGAPGSTAPAPGCAGVVLAGDTITLPAGVALDLGGIGKGYAADLVAALLLDLGATGACVAAGGDVRVAGAGSWTVAVESPWDPAVEIARIALLGGAVATSSAVSRSWTGPGGERLHHLVDPRTGRPAAGGVAAVTAVAGEAWWAEVAAKAALVAGRGAALDVLARLGTPGLVVLDDGDVRRTPDLDDYLSEVA